MMSPPENIYKRRERAIKIENLPPGENRASVSLSMSQFKLIKKKFCRKKLICAFSIRTKKKREREFFFFYFSRILFVSKAVMNREC